MKGLQSILAARKSKLKLIKKATFANRTISASSVKSKSSAGSSRSARSKSNRNKTVIEDVQRKTSSNGFENRKGSFSKLSEASGKEAIDKKA